MRRLLGLVGVVCTVIVSVIAQTNQKPTVLLAYPFIIDDLSTKYDLLGAVAGNLLALEDVISEKVITRDELDVLTVNIWDPNLPKDADINSLLPGGYSSAVLYDAYQNRNVIGITGDYYSRTTRFSAGLASSLQIPFCGCSQGSLSLSNKDNYPYFFRTQAALGLGKHQALVLRTYGAKKVCILHGRDELSLTMMADLRSGLQSFGIRVITVAVFQQSSAKDDDLTPIFNRIKGLNCRFFYTAMQSEEVVVAFSGAVKSGLVTNETLWSSLNPIVPPLAENYTPPYFGNFIFQDFYSMNASARAYHGKRLWSFVNSSQVINDYFAELDIPFLVNASGSDIPGFFPGAYNCMRTLINGFVQIKKARALSGFSQLSGFRPLMNYTAFMNTGYVDIFGNEVKFNEYGDSDPRVLALMTNKSNWEENVSTEDYRFGHTLPGAQRFVELFPPVFRSGSTTPPADEDDSIVSYVIQEGSGAGIVIRICQGIALLAFIGIGVLCGLRAGVLPATQPWLPFLLLGAFLGAISTSLAVRQFEARLCGMTALFFVAGLTTISWSTLYILVCSWWFMGNEERLESSLRYIYVGLAVVPGLIINMGTAGLRIEGKFGWTEEETFKVIISERGPLKEQPQPKEFSLFGMKTQNVLTDESKQFKEELGIATTPQKKGGEQEAGFHVYAGKLILLASKMHGRYLFRLKTKDERDAVAKLLKDAISRCEQNGFTRTTVFLSKNALTDGDQFMKSSAGMLH
ncbi:hypothetical protein HDU96_009294 [Phlyctochytrium bullatum]|nr:hypothetical protein HDU96_009294 [Phlyctochytrium bullatum]